MLLSIGMIVKNEEKYLRDCLTAVKPILEQVESELIICDTGSTDSTVEIAKEFTSNVFQIEWKNDFAWARNQTLNKAKGEWFLFIDADEIFLDNDDIIKFFISGEYKNYNSAGYRLRNKVSDGNYHYTHALRLYKIECATRFEGEIHEYMRTSQPQIKNLESIAEHYGYYNQHFAKEKYERNIKPLLKMYEDDPKNIRTISHIINEYLVHEDTCDEGKKYIDIGFDVVGDEMDNPYYHVLYHNLMSYYKKKGANEEIIRTARKYLNGLTEFNYGVIQVRYMETLALIEIGRFEDAAKSAEQSLECFDKYKREKQENLVDKFLSINTTVADNRLVYISLILMSYIGAGEFDKSLKWLAEHEETKANTTEYDIFEHLASTFEKNKQWSGFTNMYQFALYCGMESTYPDDIIATIETFASSSAENKEGIVSAFVTKIDFAKIPHNFSIKALRLLSRISMFIMEGSIENTNITGKQKIYLHETAIRIAHEYLNILYNPSIYQEKAVESLSETDAYTFYAGEAYARKDAGDILGFVRGLRAAVNLNPKMKDIILLCVEELR